MSPNLTMSPDLGTEDWDPDVITRMIFIGPGAQVSEQEIVTAFHMLGLPLTIKNTCYLTNQHTPCESIASETFLNPEILAPKTVLYGFP